MKRLARYFIDLGLSLYVKVHKNTQNKLNNNLEHIQVLNQNNLELIDEVDELQQIIDNLTL